MTSENTLLIVAEMATSGATTGVNRYLSQWLDALANTQTRIIYLRFESNRFNYFVHREQKQHYLEVTIPLPEAVPTLVGRQSRMQQYMEVIFPSIQDCFEEGCILHLHTINLIDLALHVKKRMGCHVIMHLHCIPWKNLYNSNRERFAFLQRKVTQHQKARLRKAEFYVISNEQEAYEHADEIICVTHSGQAFLEQQGIDNRKISVIYNGLPESSTPIRRSYQLSPLPKVLFVGSAHQSKGLSFVIKAIDQLQKCGYPVELIIAGRVRPQHKAQWQEEFPNLHLDFKGNLPYEELCVLYREADIGVIASLQEQCSYAAIEMMMHALPIVSTAVDGLGEMFTHEQDALLTDVDVNEDGMLTFDVNQLTTHLIRLLHDRNLRQRIGLAARQRYLQQFSMAAMYRQTLQVYHQILKSCPE